MRQNWSMPKLFADENYPADMLCGTTGKDLKNCSNWFSKFNERRENHLEARVKPIKDATGKVGTSRERNLLQKHLNKFTEIEKYFR